MFLLLLLIVNIVIVLYDFLTLLPKLWNQLVDKLGLSLKLLLELFILLMNLDFFVLKLLFACSNILSRNVLFVFSFPWEIVRHPLHLVEEERPVRFLFESNFLRLNLSSNVISQIWQILCNFVSFFSQLINQKLRKWNLQAFFLGQGPTFQFCTYLLPWYLTFSWHQTQEALEQRFPLFLELFSKFGFIILYSFLWQPYLTWI